MILTTGATNFYIFFFSLFGSLLGSFSNVVILRMSTKTSVIFPPSACPKCNHQLSALDLVPVFSWLFLKGKCRYCKTPISYQYPLVEFFIALILGASFYKLGLGLEFVGFASALTIWFIAAVVFLRNEVHSSIPFYGALLYNLLLFKFFCGYQHTAMDIRILLLFTAATYVGCYVGHKKATHKLTTLTPISLLWLAKFFSAFYVGLIFLLVAPLIRTKCARIVFFIAQLLSIVLVLYN